MRLTPSRSHISYKVLDSIDLGGYDKFKKGNNSEQIGTGDIC